MPPALDTAAARGPPDVLAMPASMMGYLMPSSLHSGVLRGGGDDMLTSNHRTRRLRMRETQNRGMVSAIEDYRGNAEFDAEMNVRLLLKMCRGSCFGPCPFSCSKPTVFEIAVSLNIALA